MAKKVTGQMDAIGAAREASARARQGGGGGRTAKLAAIASRRKKGAAKRGPQGVLGNPTVGGMAGVGAARAGGAAQRVGAKRVLRGTGGAISAKSARDK